MKLTAIPYRHNSKIMNSYIKPESVTAIIPCSDGDGCHVYFGGGYTHCIWPEHVTARLLNLEIEED